MRRLLLLGCALALVGCAAMQEGPPVNLEAIATPDMVKAATPTPALPPRPVPSSGMLRVWIPRQVAPNGDVIAGHYMEVSSQAPAQEVLPPSKHIPRAPQRPARIVQPKAVRQEPPSVPPEMLPEGSPVPQSPGVTIPPILPTFPLPGDMNAIRP